MGISFLIQKDLPLLSGTNRAKEEVRDCRFEIADCGL
jgi:hypothetical protein